MFSAVIDVVVWAVAIAALLHAAWRADWRRLAIEEDGQVLFAACVLLWLVWRLRTSIPGYEAMDFHLLMVTTVTLMFGRYFALLVVLVAEGVFLVDAQGSWTHLPFDIIAKGLVPVLVTVLVYRLCVRYLPRHFFIYIYLGAFLGGALSILLSRLVSSGLLLYKQEYTLDQLADYFSLLPIMMFAEAFMNGAIMTLLVVYRPEWVSSFDDRKYLHNK